MVLNLEQIKELIPHREPFLFVDKVTEISDSYIEAVKELTGDEDFFKGHFPSNPIMPGVLMLEALAQSACILGSNNINILYKKDENTTSIKPKNDFYLASTNNVKFHKIVTPNSTLVLQVTLIKSKSNFLKFRANALVSGDIVCSAEFMAYIK